MERRKREWRGSVEREGGRVERERGRPGSKERRRVERKEEKRSGKRKERGRNPIFFGTMTVHTCTYLKSLSSFPLPLFLSPSFPFLPISTCILFPLSFNLSSSLPSSPSLSSLLPSLILPLFTLLSSHLPSPLPSLLPPLPTPLFPPLHPGSDTSTQGVLYYVDNNVTLHWLVNSGPHPPYIAMVEPEMFTRFVCLTEFTLCFIHK